MRRVADERWWPVVMTCGWNKVGILRPDSELDPGVKRSDLAGGKPRGLAILSAVQ